MSKEPDDIIDCMARMKGEEQPFAVATVVHVRGGASAREGSKAVATCFVGQGRKLGFLRLLPFSFFALEERIQLAASAFDKLV